MSVLIQLGNKVPLAYFYTLLGLLIWYYSQNKNEKIKAFIAINNVLYLGFSALTVLWFVPTWWKLASPIFAADTVQGTAFYNTVLTYMSAYLLITILPTLLAIVFVVKKWRWSIPWSLIVLVWTSPVASLLLRKLWWEVKVIWNAKSVQGAVFELNFFKHVDLYLLLALLLNVGLLYLVHQMKLLPEMQEEE